MALASIQSLLKQTVAELQRFLVIIATEREALISGEITQLSTLAEEKSALATRLATLESHRENILREAGFATGREGIDAWLAANATPSASGPSAIPALWQQIIILAAETRRENETNGKLITVLMQQNQQALGTLLRQPVDTTTYDADGQQKTKAWRRPLGNA